MIRSVVGRRVRDCSDRSYWQAAAAPEPAAEAALIQALRQRLAAIDLARIRVGSVVVLARYSGTGGLPRSAEPLALFDAMQRCRALLGNELKPALHDLLEQCRKEWSQRWPDGQGARWLTGVAWNWLIEGMLQLKR